MSRYLIPPKTDTSLEVIVGWDAPLSTFFGNVVRYAPDDAPLDIEDENILLTGGHLGEHVSVADLQNTIMEFATIPSDVWHKMEQDSLVPYEYSAIQLWVRETIEGAH